MYNENIKEEKNNVVVIQKKKNEKMKEELKWTWQKFTHLEYKFVNNITNQ